jgi:hypothetical protein
VGEVTVVAPERDRSGASNSLTLDRPLTVRKAANGFRYINGTPTDCVHIALTGLVDPLPDLVVSGINFGANMGDDTIYSGTVAAATRLPVRHPVDRDIARRQGGQALRDRGGDRAADGRALRARADPCPGAAQRQRA